MPANVHPKPFIIHPPANLLTAHRQLRRNSVTLAQKYAFQKLVTEEDLQIMGRGLWNVLNLDASFAAAHKTAGRQILPIIIESDDPALLQLPWETLRHPDHGFLGRSPAFTLSRRVAPPDESPDTPEKGPLRVLLFTSLPDDVDPEKSRLNVEDEQAQVQDALTPWIAEGLVQLEMPDDGRLTTLREYLRTFQPHLVFLSGHGKFHHQPLQKEPPYAAFAFEDEYGRTRSVRDQTIAQAFVGSTAQLIVLSACESGKTVSDALNVGLTRQLSQLGVPHVIGMRE
ncbi:MAG: hypothetical protein B6243_13265, partial [Anaerolineaceae bacterium 4572_5.2]